MPIQFCTVWWGSIGLSSSHSPLLSLHPSQERGRMVCSLIACAVVSCQGNAPLLLPPPPYRGERTDFQLLGSLGGGGEPRSSSLLPPGWKLVFKVTLVLYPCAPIFTMFFYSCKFLETSAWMTEDFWCYLGSCQKGAHAPWRAGVTQDVLRTELRQLL